MPDSSVDAPDRRAVWLYMGLSLVAAGVGPFGCAALFLHSAGNRAAFVHAAGNRAAFVHAAGNRAADLFVAAEGD